ncbi:MAG: DUF6492 family protein [Candidatus Competibacterales bacterium]
MEQRIAPTLITPTYAPDFERAELLCRSVDRFVADCREHLLVIDRRDQALFRPLAGDNRRLVIKEELLPPWLHPPLVGRRWWWSWRTLPVRGWIVQQIAKLSMGSVCEGELLVFADSDVAFVRPFCLGSLATPEGARLYAGPRKPEDYRDRRHNNWYRHAASVFDLAGDAHCHRDYITQLVVWRRSVLGQLTAALTAKAGYDWRLALARTLDFSEYILYGVFVEHVLGLAAAGHFATEEELAYCSWHHTIASPGELAAFLRAVPPHYPAVLIQSNLGFDPAQYGEQLVAGE